MPEEVSLPPTYVASFHDEEAVKAMPYLALGNTGLMISKISLGAASFGALAKKEFKVYLFPAEDGDCFLLTVGGFTMLVNGGHAIR